MFGGFPGFFSILGIFSQSFVFFPGRSFNFRWRQFVHLIAEKKTNVKRTLNERKFKSI